MKMESNLNILLFLFFYAYFSIKSEHFLYFYYYITYYCEAWNNFSTYGEGGNGIMVISFFVKS